MLEIYQALISMRKSFSSLSLFSLVQLLVLVFIAANIESVELTSFSTEKY